MAALLFPTVAPGVPPWGLLGHSPTTLVGSPTIALSPAALVFGAAQGGANPSAQPVTIANVGTGTLSGLGATVSYGSGAGWLTASLDATTAPATCTVTPATGALAAGSYTATVSVTASGAGTTNSPQTFVVTLVVVNAAAPPPVTQLLLAAPRATVALYSSADCLQRCRDAAQLPVDDEAMDDAAWYRLLTAAQAKYYPALAAHVPHVLYSDPQTLESFDGGLTYPFGVDEDSRPVLPLGPVLVFRQESHASEPDFHAYALRAGVDYIAEADVLRLRTTATTGDWPDGGPWVRMIEPPGVIDAAHEPVLLPVHARELLVLDAVEQWATQGGLRDPSPWVGRAQKLWGGDPMSPGDVGLRGALKLQFPAPPPRGRFVSRRVSGLWLPGGWTR